MTLGEKLVSLRKKAGLSQEEVAEKLGVSRQTVSKWEMDQTVPELTKSKMLSELYNISYDSLISESINTEELTSIEKIVDAIDWTKAWSTKYPILERYPNIKGISNYQERMGQMFEDFKKDFAMNDMDTILVLKDILYQVYRQTKKKGEK